MTDPDGRPTLKISGDIDLASAPRLIEAALGVGGGVPTAVPLLVDLSDVTFIDSSGLGAFVQIRNTLAEAGCSLVIIAQSRAVELAVGYGGLADVFEVGKGL